MKLVMVQGGALGFGVGASVSGGVFAGISSTPKTKAFVDNKGVYAGPLFLDFFRGERPGVRFGNRRRKRYDSAWKSGYER